MSPVLADASAIKVGTADASAVYIGSTKVWPTTGGGGVYRGYRFNNYGSSVPNPGDWYVSAADKRYRINKVDADGRDVPEPDGDHIVTFADGTQFTSDGRIFSSQPDYWLSSQSQNAALTAYAAAHPTMDVYIDGPFYVPSLSDLILSYNPLHYWPLDDDNAPFTDLGSSPSPLTVAGGTVTTRVLIGGSVYGMQGDGDVARLTGGLLSDALQYDRLTLLAFGRNAANSARGNAQIIGRWRGDADEKSILFNQRGSPWRAAVNDSGTFDSTYNGSVSDPWMASLVFDSGTARVIHNDAWPTATTGLPSVWFDSGTDVDAPWMALTREPDLPQYTQSWIGPLAHIAVIPDALTQSDIENLHTAFLAETA